VGMSMKAITFEAPEDTVQAFDDAVASVSLSREEALQGLMESYLFHDKGFRASVAIGLQQADAGLLLNDSEIEAHIQPADDLQADLEESERQIAAGETVPHEEVVAWFNAPHNEIDKSEAAGFAALI
jgi:predicted transcriptional regulator